MLGCLAAGLTIHLPNVSLLKYSLIKVHPKNCQWNMRSILLKQTSIFGILGERYPSAFTEDVEVSTQKDYIIN